MKIEFVMNLKDYYTNQDIMFRNVLCTHCFLYVGLRLLYVIDYQCDNMSFKINFYLNHLKVNCFRSDTQGFTLYPHTKEKKVV